MFPSASMILPNLDIKGFRMNAGFRVQLADGDVEVFLIFSVLFIFYESILINSQFLYVLCYNISYDLFSIFTGIPEL